MNERFTIYDLKTEKYILDPDFSSIPTVEDLIQRIGELEQELEWQNKNYFKEDNNNGIN